MSATFCLPKDAGEALARSGVYGLLGRLLIREVDEPLFAELQTPAIEQAFRGVGGEVPSPEDSVEQLSHDYCQLFIGPANHLPPYQSVWTTGQFEGSTAASMRRFIDLIRYDDDAHRGTMPDHLGVELHVMSLMLRLWADSTKLSEVDKSSFAEMLSTFAAAHLFWATSAPLLPKAEEQAQSAFYQSVIRMTRGFLSSELASH